MRAVIHSARFLDVDRIALCPRCGFSGGRVDEEVVWDKLALVASAAAELLG